MKSAGECGPKATIIFCCARYQSGVLFLRQRRLWDITAVHLAQTRGLNDAGFRNDTEVALWIDLSSVANLAEKPCHRYPCRRTQHEYGNNVLDSPPMRTQMYAPKPPPRS